MGYLTVHHVPFTVRRAEAVFVRRLDNYADGILGGGYLLSPRAAANKIELSDREKEIIRGL